jgi:O-antigen ligase
VTALAAVLILGTLAWRFFHSKLSRRWKFIILGAVVAVPAVVAVTGVLQSSMIDFLTRGQDAHGLLTLTGRTTIWERALDYWATGPVIGHGYYAGHRLGLAEFDPLFASYSNIDSTWIETLVDEGVLGLLLLGAYFVTTTVRVFRLGAGRQERGVSIAAICLVDVMAFFNPTVQFPTSTLVLFAVLSFSAAPQAVRSDKAHDPADPRKE